MLAVYTGAAVEALDLIDENNDEGNDALTSAVSFRATGGTEYQIAVDGFDGDSGIVELGWSFAPEKEEIPFRRGDVLDDNQLDLADPVSTLNFLFLNGEPSSWKSADTDDSGAIDLTDAIYLLNYLFLDGPQPPAPFASCGGDPTSDDLTCESHGGCQV